MANLATIEKEQLAKFQKLVVIGDLHGDFKALKVALKMVDPTDDGLIFLGDYADRGPCGVEVIETVNSLVKKYPGNIFALKGNHEYYHPSGKPIFGGDWYSLIDEVEDKRGNWQYYFTEEFTPFMEQLALAAIIPGEALFVHGGVSEKITSIANLNNPTKEIEEDILWSDPIEENGEYTGIWGKPKFGPNISAKVCQKLGVKKIIRSHEPSRVMKAGRPCYTHNGRVLTTSTTQYCVDITKRYQPFLLSISPVDFSIKYHQIATDPLVESEDFSFEPLV